jgi:hypothetical protein
MVPEANLGFELSFPKYQPVMRSLKGCFQCIELLCGVAAIICGRRERQVIT